MKTVYLLLLFLNIVSINSQSPDQLYGELFHAVQIRQTFPDTKTFCDAIPRNRTPAEILYLYQQEQNKTTFNLTAFVLNHFILPEITIITHDRWTIEEHCHRLWSLLTRTTSNETFSSLIDVPYPFVVPGGRFREFYYWDTYFTMLGLVRSNESQLIEDMLNNFAYLIRTIGFIPNGNRYYYQGRSQPPFFSLMAELVAKTNEYRRELELEYQFWMTKRTITFDDDEGTVLNRYYDDLYDRPRTEAYVKDIELAARKNDTHLYAHLRAAAESGWDFSSRWMENGTDLLSLITANIIPIDLNCLLYHLELVLGKTMAAQRRRQAIHKYLWSDERKFFFDYNYVKKQSMDHYTLAAVFPLWLNVSTTDQAKHIARQIESLFLRDGGVVTTLSRESAQQWDHPNGWAPLQFVTYRALLQTPGYASLARTIRQRWMSINERVFNSTGKMMEKYDVVDTNRPAGGGLYTTQDGFGWTNGVYLEMLYDTRNELTSTASHSARYTIVFFQMTFAIALRILAAYQNEL